MNRIFQYSVKIGVVAICFILLVLAIISIPSGNAKVANSQLGYPAPIAEPTPLTQQETNGYPPPVSPTDTGIPAKATRTQIPTFLASLDAAVATNIAIKANHTPSSIEIAAIATEMYDKSHMPTLSVVSQPNGFSMSINSINDLPDFVYSDPFYLKNDKDMSSCIQAKIPGKALLIKALDNLPDYYLLPFYKDKRVCGIASIEIKGGKAITEGWATVNYEKFPIIDANEAINQVILKTGKKISGSPILAAGGYREIWNPFNPAWQLVSEDGEEYYVISHSGMVEEGQVAVSTNIFNSNEMHKIK
jgi:hypothetical protein